MKTYKVCYECILDLKNCAFYEKGGVKKLNASNKFSNCLNKPRCFDQPERSKREDSCCYDISIIKEAYGFIQKEFCASEDQHDKYIEPLCTKINDIIKRHEMRCSEHCGNTVRDK